MTTEQAIKAEIKANSLWLVAINVARMAMCFAGGALAAVVVRGISA